MSHSRRKFFRLDRLRSEKFARDGPSGVRGRVARGALIKPLIRASARPRKAQADWQFKAVRGDQRGIAENLTAGTLGDDNALVQQNRS